MKKPVKIFLIIFASLFALIFLVIAGTAFVFRNEISVYSSIRQLKPADRDVLQGGVYEITYKGNYYFDELSLLWCPAEQFQNVQGMLKYQIKNGKIIEQ